MKSFIFILGIFFKVREYSSSLYDKPVPEVIEAYGYPSESHSLFTADDYNLVLHRIPYGRRCKKEHSQPVLLQHGIFQNSLCWLYLGPDYSLGFLLADDCYDVWLANGRGSCYSRGHKYLNTNQAKYWEFSYHEMGVYDISAFVDYIVDVTKQKDVMFIGVSQGVTSALVSAIYHPNIKIKAFFLLAPVAYFTNSPSISRDLSPAEPILTLLTQTLLGNFELGFTNSNMIKLVKKILCGIAPHACPLIYAYCGFDAFHMNLTAVTADFVRMCGVSSKQLWHYMQGFYLDFSEYNYGLSNLKKYGTSSPPRYNVETINKPVYLYHSRNDLCADLADVEILAKKLGSNVAKNHLVDDQNFDHLGFNANVRVKELVYDVLMSHMREALN